MIKPPKLWSEYLTLLRTYTTRNLRSITLLVYIHNSRQLPPRNGRVILSWLGLPLQTWQSWRCSLHDDSSPPFFLSGGRGLWSHHCHQPCVGANVHLDIFRMTGCVQSIWQRTSSLRTWRRQPGRHSGCWFRRKVWTYTPPLWPWPSQQNLRALPGSLHHAPEMQTNANFEWMMLWNMCLLFVDFIFVYIKKTIVVCPSLKM